MSRSWLVLSVPIAIVALALLLWTIRSLVRTVRTSVVTSVPIRAEQPIVFTAAGNFILNIEATFGRSWSNAQSLRYMLSSARAPESNLLAQTIVPLDVTSMSRARRNLYSITIPSPGSYILRIDGIDPSYDYSDFALVITRPFGPLLVFHIIALIALGFAVIGSIVVSSLILSGKLPGPIS